MVIYFPTDGKFFTDSSKLECKNSANIFAFFWITVVGTSISWHILDLSKFKISFSISFFLTSENEKRFFTILFYLLVLVSILGWFLYFKTIFIIGWVKFSEFDLLSVYSEILRLEKHQCLTKWLNYFLSVWVLH